MVSLKFVILVYEMWGVCPFVHVYVCKGIGEFLHCDPKFNQVQSNKNYEDTTFDNLYRIMRIFGKGRRVHLLIVHNFN